MLLSIFSERLTRIVHIFWSMLILFILFKSKMWRNVFVGLHLIANSRYVKMIAVFYWVQHVTIRYLHMYYIKASIIKVPYVESFVWICDLCCNLLTKETVSALFFRWTLKTYCITFTLSMYTHPDWSKHPAASICKIQYILCRLFFRCRPKTVVPFALLVLF